MKPNVNEYKQYCDDYSRTHPDEPLVSPARISKLADVERVLESKGLDWLSISPDQWLEVYEALGTVSTQRISLFDSGIKCFYDWAIKEAHYLSPLDSPYRKVNATQVYNIGIKAKYLSSLDELLEKIDDSQKREFKLPEESKRLNKAYLSLLWYGLSEAEMLQLKTNSLYPDKDYVDEPMLNLKTMKDGKEKLYRLSPSAATRILLDYQKEAKLAQVNGESESPAPLLIGYGAGKTKSGASTISEGSLTMRIKRSLNRINEMFSKEYTAKTIQQSGYYSRIYNYFKANGIPFFYTEESANELLKGCGLRTEMRPSDKKKEFHKFVEYVKEIKGEDIIL